MTHPITLNEIKKHRPGKARMDRLLQAVDKTAPDDDPILFSQITQSAGIYDAIWCLRAVKERRLLIEIACRMVEAVLPLYESGHPGDDRPRKAVEAARACRGPELRAQGKRAEAWDEESKLFLLEAGDMTHPVAHAVRDVFVVATWTGESCAVAVEFVAKYTVDAAERSGRKGWRVTQAKIIREVMG